MKTLLELFLQSARAYPARAAVVADRQTLTYAELATQVAQYAASLRAINAGAGDHIALLLPNSAVFVIGYFAILALGAIVVPLNDQSEPSEIATLLQDSHIELMVTSQAHQARYERAGAQIVCIENLLTPIDARLENFLPNVCADAPAMCQFSSGSTGQPKRITRTHANVAYELAQIIPTLGFNPNDRFIGVAPFSHVNGLVRSMLASLSAGATLYPIRKFERRAVAELIERERITVFIGVPFMFSTLAQTNFERAPDFSSLRLTISASAPMPKKFNLLYREKFGGYVRQLYGSTETGTMSINLSPDIERTLDSVGTPIPGVQFKLLSEHGTIAPEGEVGEIAVSSPAAITAYEGMSELNAQVFRDGYFLTGDLGRFDGGGLLYLVGRKSFYINKGGYKIDPHQVEEILERHPNVEEAAVVGVPTQYGDEQVKAVVVLRAPCTETELVEFCRDKLSVFKIPSIIEFRAQLPKNAAGKILRKML